LIKGLGQQLNSTERNIGNEEIENVLMLCAVIKHAGIYQNTREVF
jgi:hypothetical protein